MRQSLTVLSESDIWRSLDSGTGDSIVP